MKRGDHVNLKDKAALQTLQLSCRSRMRVKEDEEEVTRSCNVVKLSLPHLSCPVSTVTSRHWRFGGGQSSRQGTICVLAYGVFFLFSFFFKSCSHPLRLQEGHAPAWERCDGGLAAASCPLLTPHWTSLIGQTDSQHPIMPYGP